MQQREFDLMTPGRHIRMGIRPVGIHELPLVVDIARADIPALSAGISQVETVVRQNADSVLAFHRDGQIVGVYAMLLLSASGLERLLLGELDTSAPDEEALVETGEQPAAIYNWAVVAHRLAAEGFRHASLYLRQPIYRRANIYARGTTPAACRIMERSGYQLLGGQHADLYRYLRMANRQVRLPVAA